MPQLLLSCASVWHCKMCEALAIYLGAQIKLALPWWAARKPDVSLLKPTAQETHVNQHVPRKQ